MCGDCGFCGSTCVSRVLSELLHRAEFAGTVRAASTSSGRPWPPLSSAHAAVMAFLGSHLKLPSSGKPFRPGTLAVYTYTKRQPFLSHTRDPGCFVPGLGLLPRLCLDLSSAQGSGEENGMNSTSVSLTLGEYFSGSSPGRVPSGIFHSLPKISRGSFLVHLV